MSTLSRRRLVFLYTLITALVPVTGSASEKGVVDCVLEWHNGRQTYVYVFSGIVSIQGKPCPNARIQLQLSTSTAPDLTEETIASADGAYQLQISLSGNPEQTADWKLIAQAPGASSLEAVEIEGRSILMDQENTVLVERPIQLVQG